MSNFKLHENAVEMDHIPSNATVKITGFVNYKIKDGVFSTCKNTDEDAKRVGFCVFETREYEYFVVDCCIFRIKKSDRYLPIYRIVSIIHETL